MNKTHVTILALCLPLTGLLAGCSAEDLLVDKMDESVSKTADTSKQGVASGLLPAWVPDGGTDVKLEQRSTGNERIFTMAYSGALPSDQCTPIASAGKPNEQELASSYAKDPRTADLDVSQVATEPTLSAEWWDEGAEKKTTSLCGRWWVHQQDGQLFAFAPDAQSVVDDVKREREAAASRA